MFGILDAIKIGVGVIAGAAIAYPIGEWSGNAQGRAELKLETAAAAAAVEAERVKDDAVLSGLSRYDLCRRSFERRGMPVDACAELRRVPGQ